MLFSLQLLVHVVIATQAPSLRLGHSVLAGQSGPLVHRRHPVSSLAHTSVPDRPAQRFASGAHSFTQVGAELPS
jgi:hypothetical protein